MTADRLAALAQGRGSRRAFWWLNEQLGQMNIQCFRDTIEKIDCRVCRLPVETAHIGTIDPGIVRQLLLRDTAIYADPADIPGHERTSFHAPRQPFGWPSNHGL